MTHVFHTKAWGQRTAQQPEEVRRKILHALDLNEWVSTGELYDATLRKVRRDLMHAVLKDLLEKGEIRLRVRKLEIGRDRTEFKRVLPNV